MINFDPLFDFLHFNKLIRKNLIDDVGLNPATVAKFKKGESVSLATIEKICLHYNIPIEQVVEIIPDESDEED